MVLKRIVSGEVKIIYLDLAESFGFYRIRPGKPPFICLSAKLLVGESEGVHRNVFRVLLDLHRSIPVDSIYRLFPMRKHFEQLLTNEPVDLTPALPEIIILGRASRQWRYAFYETEIYHLVG